MEENKELIILEGISEELKKVANPTKSVTEATEDTIVVPEPEVKAVNFNPFMRVPQGKQVAANHDAKRKAKRKAQKKSRKINRKNR